MEKQIHVMIAEDDADLNEAYAMTLASQGYKVTSAHDGKDALDAIEENGDPDVLFLDLKMPNMDGIGFLKQYDPALHPDTTIIVFSNYDGQKEVDEAYELGVYRYILKARATPKELIRIVESTVAEKV